MKKIFILPILIAPIMAHATDPVGPSAVGQGETPVVATASAPYATAGAETGDTTNVVSASYVKGAYNDAIAAVNKVNADKQEKMFNVDNDIPVNGQVLGRIAFNEIVSGARDNMLPDGEAENVVPTARAVANEIANVYDNISDNYQPSLVFDLGGGELEPVNDLVHTELNGNPRSLVTDSAVTNAINSKRVSAVTTWGDDTHPTNLQLTTALN